MLCYVIRVVFKKLEGDFDQVKSTIKRKLSDDDLLKEYNKLTDKSVIWQSY